MAVMSLMRSILGWLGVALVGALGAAPAAAQNGSSHVAPPFEVGERLQYSVSYGFVPAGTMEVRVAGIERVADRPAYHFVMEARSNRAVSTLFEIAAHEESWFDVAHHRSLRYERRNIENEKTRTKSVRFDPAARSATVTERGETETETTSPDAVDQLAFMYYIRLLDLRPGARFVLNNQVDPGDNPVTVRVLKKERVRVPAGNYDAYVLDLEVQTDSGFFKEGGENRIWVSADARRLVLKMSSKVGIGSFQAELVEHGS